jgi:hypothetical protein
MTGRPRSVTCAITACAGLLALCLATGSSAQGLSLDKIASVAPNTYMIREGDRLFDVDAQRAMKRAREYCARMRKTVVTRGQTWDVGYGYTLTWSCEPQRHAPALH